MDKSSAKFLLPSPNFNKSANDAAQSSKLHYLTPCGMSLLPRTKQPPPMYGARGATVPAKFLQPPSQQEQQFKQTFIYPGQPNTNYESAGTKPSEEPPQYCEACDMELQSAQDLRRHLQQHEPCPVAECQYVGHPAVLDKHIEAMHVTNLYREVKKMSTPEEIATWRAERRKRYPTVANVEQRERAKEQRQRRGERLEKSKNRFGNLEDRKRVRHHEATGGTSSDKQKEKQQANKRKHPQERNNTEVKCRQEPGERKQPPKKYPRNEKQMQEDDENCCGGIPMFKGTSSMMDYKHFKSKKPESVNVLSSLLGMYGSDGETTDDDDEMESDQEEIGAMEYEVADKNETETVEQRTSAADVQEAKEKSEDCESSNKAPEEASIIREEEPLLEEKDDQEVKIMEVSLSIDETQEKSEDCDSSNEAPEEAPIIRIVEPILETKAEATQKTEPSKAKESVTQNQRIPKGRHHAKPKPQPKKRQSGLNYQKFRLRKQNTMLEKLLESDIRHERNVLLQCVRFVCENNFFGIGQQKETESKSTTDSS